MAPCDGTQFNPFDIWGESVENEVGISTNCVSNLMKICVFSIYGFIFLLLALVTSAGLIKEYLRSTKWNNSKRRLLWIGLASYVHLALFAIWITGTFNRGKYVLFPATYYFIFIPGNASIREWAFANTLMRKRTMSEERRRKINIYFIIMSIYQPVGFVLLWTVLPMIFFDNPWVLNWVYIAGYVHTGFVCALLSFFGLFLADNLLSILNESLKQAVPDKKVERFCEDLKSFTRKAKIAVTVVSSMVLLIIWVPVTQTETNPGLDNFFYFEFFVSIPIRIVLMMLITKLGWKGTDRVAQGSSGSGSNNGSQSDLSSDRKKGGSFSFSVDDLNNKKSETNVEVQEA